MLRVPLPLLLLVSCTMLLLSGCPPGEAGGGTGGGGGSGATGGGSTGGGNTGTGGSTGTGGGTVTTGGGIGGGTGGGGGTGAGGGSGDGGVEAWFGAYQRIFDFAYGLPGPHTGDAWRAAVLAFLQAQPEVLAAGRDEDGLWAILAEGVPLRLFDNRAPDADLDAGLDLVARPPPEAFKTDVPKGTRARLINTMGAAFINESTPLRPLLAARGYAVVDDPGTVDSLRNLSGDSVFYISAHGGTVLIPLYDSSGNVRRLPDGGVLFDQSYGVMTKTLVDRPAAVAYQADLKAGRLGLSVALDHYLPDGGEANEGHFYVTDKWAAASWYFAQDALVWISACSSQSSDATFFRSACLANVGNGTGAGLYVGWTRPVASSAATLGAKFVFDRLLGANLAAPKETPPQRPFDYPAVWTNLRARGLHLHPSTDGGTTELTYTPGGASQFGLLAPSLEYVLIDELADEAILVGLFGMPDASERAVLIGGLEATVNDWTENRIRVALPRSGTGSRGDVLVSVRGHDSNLRRITEWNLQLTYGFAETPLAPCKVDGPVTVRFRADIGEYREQPGQAPVKPVRYAIATADSQAFLTASGSHTSGSCTTTWSGSGQLTPPAQVNPPLILVAWAKLDVPNQQFSLGLAVGSTPADLPWMSTVACSGSPPVTTPFAVAFGLLDQIDLFGSPVDPSMPAQAPLPSLVTGMTTGWGLGGGNRAYDTGGLVISLDWAATPADSPPDTSAAR